MSDPIDKQLDEILASYEQMLKIVEIAHKAEDTFNRMGYEINPQATIELTKSKLKQLIVENLTAYHKAVMEGLPKNYEVCPDEGWYKQGNKHMTQDDEVAENVNGTLDDVKSHLNTIAKQFGLQQHSDEGESHE